MSRHHLHDMDSIPGRSTSHKFMYNGAYEQKLQENRHLCSTGQGALRALVDSFQINSKLVWDCLHPPVTDDKGVTTEGVAGNEQAILVVKQGLQI